MLTMSIEKAALRYVFPAELLEHFDLISVQEFGNISTKEDFYEIVFEEKNILPADIDSSEYESKGFFSKTIQDFPLRGRAVFLKIRRRRWRHKLTGASISKDFSIIAEGTKLTQEMAFFLKEGSGNKG